MSLTVALKTAASGLQAAQGGLRTTSDNIANVNTSGYVRKTIDQKPLVVGGMGMGVEISGVKRITDQYLQLATLSATSDAARWGTVSDYLDNAQSLFGDPSSSNFFFSRMDSIYAAFSAAADDPSSSLLRSQAIGNVGDFLSEASRITTHINELGKTVDAQAKADIDRANDLLEQINRLNSDISRANLANADASGSANIQSQLIDELANLMNVQIQQRNQGGVNIRSAEGFMLAGDAAAKLSYNRTDTTTSYIAIEPTGGVGQVQPITITSGDLRGLMDLRDDTLPGLADQLGEFVSRMTEQINAAHNANSSVPAPKVMTGRDTGLDLPTAVAGFTGQATIAIVDAAGVVQNTVAIDFDAQTMNPGGPFTGDFKADLNAALGGAATADFVNGKLSLTAGAGLGIAIDEGTSMKAGRAFSHFFGLNDMIRSTGVTNYDTGLKVTDQHGFNPGDVITLSLAQADGRPIRDISITVPPAGSMQDLLNAMNSSASGVGLYGAFSLDSNGKMSFGSNSTLDIQVSVTKDQTQHGLGGVSISQLFGLGTGERSPRAGRFSVDAGLNANPMKLALGKLDLSLTPPAASLRPGDGRGALSLAMAGDVTTAFSAAGELGAVNMTVSRYAAEFGGSIGRRAQAADTRKQSADSVATEATARRQSVEGVNLDEELVRLTTYQQAFNASARMIQAAKELFDVLTNMI
ncbi:flagellar hook-associated protein FlgK [Phenylobacterium sp.]|uniref:flagellar hook-associated protein FlgK n=1 Tax=Phenylobacterium sp. TaxID=1871053 RepID=UPI0027218047|nr:flagellar hook-associated protein FlgK [Phenylobacterium sp.]MDO8377598.1 flagellar hook-associated protein FlgK [Phenylobacterium sp.]